MEEVKILGEGRGGIHKFHKLCANGTANSVGEWAGELCEACFTGGVAAGKDARHRGYGVVWLQAHRALRWLCLFHGGRLKFDDVSFGLVSTHNS